MVDGWYLATSPDHYRVHNCYVKTTQAERLTDTIQFKYKIITNPTISPQDKIMLALANCKTTLKGMMNHDNPNQQMEELQTIVNNAQAHLNQQQTTSTQQVPTVDSQQVPILTLHSRHRQEQWNPPSPKQTNRNAHGTTTKPSQQPITLMAQINLQAEPPAQSTYSAVCAADDRQRVTRLCQPTQSSIRKTRQANAVTTNWRRILRKVERDIE